MVTIYLTILSKAEKGHQLYLIRHISSGDNLKDYSMYIKWNFTNAGMYFNNTSQKTNNVKFFL